MSLLCLSSLTNPPSISSDVWMCAQPQGRATGCTWPPLHGHNKVEVGNKRPFHLSISNTREKRGGNWKMPFKCSVMHVKPQADQSVNVACWRGTTTTLLVYFYTLVWVDALYRISELISWAISCQFHDWPTSDVPRLFISFPIAY